MKRNSVELEGSRRNSRTSKKDVENNAEEFYTLSSFDQLVRQK